LIGSIILHEIAHGFAADRLGDQTARLMGRLTLNPLAHIDPVGSILLPILLMLSGTGIFFGWAKPVPIHPGNFSDPRFDEVKVALAGPATNLFLAAVMGLCARFLPIPNLTDWFVVAVQVNVVLALFNVLPIPPLDGSKLLAVFLPEGVYNEFERLNPVVGFVVLFVLIQSPGFSLWLDRAVTAMTRFILGV
jgi:Zn-dependent protease